MGECTHPRGQHYTDDENRARCGACGDVCQHYTDDENRARCGACGDVWDNTLGLFRPLMMGDLMQ
jgi:hypothetical protein